MIVYRIEQSYHIGQQVECMPQFVKSVRYSAPVHCHDFYEFFIIVMGRCIHKINGMEQHLQEGDLVFIRPEDVHSYDFDEGQDCEFINVSCTRRSVDEAFDYLGGEVFSRYFMSSAEPPVTHLAPAQADELIAGYERLKMLTTVDAFQSRVMLRSMLISVFTRYFSTEHGKDTTCMPSWFETLLTQMQIKDNFMLGLERMMELADRSPGHVNRAFRQYLSTTPTAYINELRLDFAKGLLLTTDLSILEIAMEAGFDNLSHFYHLFKIRFHSTPSVYRGSRSAS